MLFNYMKNLLFIMLFTSLAFAQNYEIKFDLLNANYWFGGDNRPGNERNVTVAQSVLIDEPINLESFAFYFTAPFDSAINNTGTGHEVTLNLHIRDSIGTILQIEQIVVPDTFMGGWVTWQNINLDITETGKYIFSSYLVGGYDSNKVYSGIGCDLNANYINGEMYVKEVTTELESENWVDWSQHVWDVNFWLTGTLIPTSVKDKNQQVNYFELGQNYPNPFNPTTKISWQSSVGSWQTIKVYDVLGNEVATLVDEYKPAGNYEINFNTSHHSSGVYFYQLRTEDFIETKKLTLIK